MDSLNLKTGHGVAAKQAPPPTAAQQVYEQLRAHLLDASYQPGEKLRIKELVERYGCGSFPVREALNRLTAESLVTYSNQRGFSVAPISAEELIDITQARSWIVALAMEKAMQLGDEKWEEQVMLSYYRLSKVSRYTGPDQARLNPDYDRIHRDFHSALIAGCGSRKMVDISEDLFDQADRYRSLSRSLVPVPREDEHKLILEAVLERRVEEAVRLCVQHFERTAELAIQQLRLKE
ncbi:MAG: GntR family transcriptional regulator [Pigmentiphaga sp.]